MANDFSRAEACRDLVRRFDHPSTKQPPLHAQEPITSAGQPSTLEDHLLTTCAIVSCLAYEHSQRDWLRFAALIHDLPNEERQRELERLGEERKQVVSWVELLDEHGKALDKGEWGAMPTDEAERLLTLAHIAASRRREIAKREEFAKHPLAQCEQKVAIIYGGATKIKGYVFESVKLPEIRGASALLDHINQIDLPALWGRKPQRTRDDSLTEHQGQHYREVRQWFERLPLAEGNPALDAPECVLYASGGNILALAPAEWGRRMATAIEQRYTEVTLVANSVGVSESFSLLELQYGRYADKFWKDDAQTLPTIHSQAAQLLRQSLGQSDFAEKKGFGELVTVVTGLANRRRAGDGLATGEPRWIPFFELSSHARKCTSCDVRPAAQELEGGRYFCHACLKKQDAGTQARKGDLRKKGYEWIRPWGTWLEQEEGVIVHATADDLGDIGQGSDNYVGLIYADGNNVGAYIAELRSISAYRQFAKQMLRANEQAVAKALVKHIKPSSEKQAWPFEIITIGGDDVMLFVPAHQALEIAHDIAQEFDQGMADTNISLSTGVLIMSQSTPVRFASDLTEQLLKSAKGRAKKLKEQAENKSTATIDFMALKGIVMIAENIQAYREIALRQGKAGRKQFSLTHRPYTLHELNSLIEATRKLKETNFPRSQLYQIASYLENGYLLRSMIDYAYLVERGKKRSGSREAFTEFDDKMRELCTRPGGQKKVNEKQVWMPWRTVEAQATDKKSSDKIDYDTPLLDIIEIYPFVK